MRATGAALAVAVLVMVMLAAGAPAAVAAPWHDTCASFNKVYPHGVGTRDAQDRTSGTPVTSFKRSNRLYRAAMRANPRLDRDRDRIACERANRAPQAIDDTGSVTEDSAEVTVHGNLLANDVDPDGDVVGISMGGSGTFVTGAGANLTIDADGSYTYTLDNSSPAVDALESGQQLTDSFTYTISDGHGGTDSATLTITIHGTS